MEELYINPSSDPWNSVYNSSEQVQDEPKEIQGRVNWLGAVRLENMEVTFLPGYLIEHY